jgi:hypothetical protein
LEWTTEVKNLKKEFDEMMLVNPDFKKWVLDGNSFTRGVNNSFGMAETCAVNEIEFSHVKDVFDNLDSYCPAKCIEIENERLEKLRLVERKRVENALRESVDDFFECGTIYAKRVVFKYSDLDEYIKQFTFDSNSIVNYKGRFIDDYSEFLAEDEGLRYLSLLESTVEFHPQGLSDILSLMIRLGDDKVLDQARIDQHDETAVYYYETGGVMFGYVNVTNAGPINPRVNVLSFGERVGTVNDNTCRNFKHLTHVVLDKTVKHIGSHSFADCPNLGSFVLPNSCSVSPRVGFDGCPKLVIHRA